MICAEDIITLNKYLKNAKDEGYILQYTKLPDRLKVSFSYKNNDTDSYKEYVEYLDNLIICYGEFGTFMFRQYNIDQQPDNFYLYSNKLGLESQIGMLDKVVEDINTQCYDCDIAYEYFKNFLEENNLLENFNELSKFDKDYFEEAIYSEDSYKEKAADVCMQLINLFKEYDIIMESDCYDLWQDLSNIGLHYTEKALIVVMIITLIGYDYHINKNKKDA